MFNVNDCIVYTSGWDDSEIGGIITKVMTREQTGECDKRDYPDEQTFYEIDSDDGAGVTLPHCLVRPQEPEVLNES